MDPLDAFFEPRSVAVVGASDRPGNLAANVVRNLQEWGYEGRILPAGPRPGRVHGVEVCAPPERLPEGIDLASVLTPARTVPDLVDVLGARGVRALAVQCAGFDEHGAEGGALAQEVLARARSHGMRVVGPNCLGTISAGNGLCIPFARVRRVPAGPVAVLSQSGGMLFAYLRELEDVRLGLSRAASFGNKLDVDEADLVRWLGGDDATRVIIAYLEDVRRGRALLEAAAACGKPLVVHKGSRSPAVRRVAASHTAALAGDHAVLAAAARQAGIVLVDTVTDAFTAARAFLLPPPRGRRVAVISRSGGHAVLAADACADHGLSLPPLPDDLLADLESRVRAGVIRLANPLDLGDLWDVDAYLDVVERVAALERVDALVFLFVAISPVDLEVPRRVAEHVAGVCRRTGKPISFCFQSWNDIGRELVRRVDFPVFHHVEEAVAALGYLADRHLGDEPVSRPSPEVGAPGAAAPLPLARCLELLAAHGVPMVETRLAADPAAAAREAAALAGPLVAKLLSPAAVHKTDVGAVRLGLEGPDAVRAACEAMGMRLERELPGAPVEGFAVQPQVPAGVEVIVGFRRDRAFGPVVVVGLGGTLVEVLADVALRVAPVDHGQARAMLRELSGRALLEGVRGAPPADLDALADLVVRVSELAAAAPEEVAELELNPVLVRPEGQGCVAVDVRGVAG